MRSRLLAMMVLTLLGVNAGSAGEQVHTVRSGESASSIAKNYYADHELGLLLLEYNGKPDTTLHPGEKLVVPFSEDHTVARGDSWSGLAQRYLGKASLHGALAVVNGLSSEEPLPLGSRILIPVALPHVLRRGETLAVLAERYHGDADYSKVVQLFNGIEDPRRLSVGQTVVMPLTQLRLRERPSVEPKTPTVSLERPKPAADDDGAASVEQEEPPRDDGSRHGDRIRAAEEAFERGDYLQARATLESLRRAVMAAEGGSESERADVQRLLAFVYVAFDLREEACDAHRMSRPAALDSDEVSPKIRDMLAGCSSR
jgi:LysM repeat protein